MQKRSLFAFCVFVFASLLLVGLFSLTVGMGPDAAAEPQAGVWVDSIVFSVAAPDEAVARLDTGDLDVYVGVNSAVSLYKQVHDHPQLVQETKQTVFFDLTFNPAIFYDGRLNPFSNPKIREATNWLVDRDFLVSSIYSNTLASPKYVAVNKTSLDYLRHAAAVQTIETNYASNFALAESVISGEMGTMGAAQVGGIWEYNSQPITVTFLIRVEDERRMIGDYIADQFEALGFVVDRQYKTSTEASPIWLNDDPANGLFHLYTGGWVEDSFSRDLGSWYEGFYLPNSSFNFSPLWQSYTPDPVFEAAAQQLARHEFADLAERKSLFDQVLDLAMQDSVRIWLIEEAGFSPRHINTTGVFDFNKLSAEVSPFSSMWPMTIRFKDQVGGVMRMADDNGLGDAWNPVAGNGNNEMARPTTDAGTFMDPTSYLARPQRVDHAEVYAVTGTPIFNTLSWVTVQYVAENQVPGDAWVDWDAANQQFITASSLTSTLTTMLKTVVHYPADLFSTVTWHDGSPLSPADFILPIILQFDRAKTESAIYDDAAVGSLDGFLSDIKAVRIVSTNPLVIETYRDNTFLDAEIAVKDWWPNYASGPGAWHNVGLGIRAEAVGDLAFSWDKADANQIPWMSFVEGSSLEILGAHLTTAKAVNYIPYVSVLGNYVTPAQAADRWANLESWYAAHGHFWLGTGPFYLETISLNNQTLTLKRYDSYPDPAGKWDAFVALPPALLSVIPGSGSSAGETLLDIQGGSFQPGVLFDLFNASQGSSSLIKTTYISSTHAAAVVPAGMAPGTYDLVVSNPDGQQGRLLKGFTVWDPQPVVTGITPGSGPNDRPLSVLITGDNLGGVVNAELSTVTTTLTLEGLELVDNTRLLAVIPQGGVPQTYDLIVRSASELSATLPVAFKLESAVVYEDLFLSKDDLLLSPTGLHVGDPDPDLRVTIHRQTAGAELANIVVNIYEAPGPGVRSTAAFSQTLNFTIPAGAVAASQIVKWPLPAAGNYYLFGVIAYADSNEANNTAEILVTVHPRTADKTPPMVTSFQLRDATAQLGTQIVNSQQVFLSAAAVDQPGVGEPTSGVASLYYVEYRYDPVNNYWAVVQESGWLPYTSANSGYPWRLYPEAGMHYLEVYAADKAGNISVGRLALVNYMKTLNPVSAGQVRLYRLETTPGQSFQMTLKVFSGIADLYVWRQDALDRDLLVAADTTDNAIKDLGFTVAVDTAGRYQIEVEGISRAQYNLGITQAVLRGSAWDMLRLPVRSRGRPILNVVSDPSNNVSLPAADSEQIDYQLFLPTVRR